MKLLKILFLFFITTTILYAQNDITPDKALDILKAGNLRFVSGNPLHPNCDQVRKMETSINGEKPIATVLSCSDSRVPVDIIFDTGIGDIFSVRVAGNVSGTDEVGSIEYSVEHLKCNLLLVLGHTKCDFVSSVVNNESLKSHVTEVADYIKPSADKARKLFPNLSGSLLINETIKLNIYQSIENIFAKSELLRQRVKSGKLLIEAGIYDIESGNIEWLGKHPDQAKFIFKGASEQKAKGSTDSL